MAAGKDIHINRPIRIIYFINTHVVFYTTVDIIYYYFGFFFWVVRTGIQGKHYIQGVSLEREREVFHPDVLGFDICHYLNRTVSFF